VFPIHTKEIGVAWGETRELALATAIEILDRHAPIIEFLRGRNGQAAGAAGMANRAGDADMLIEKAVEELAA